MKNAGQLSSRTVQTKFTIEIMFLIHTVQCLIFIVYHLGLELKTFVSMACCDHHTEKWEKQRCFTHGYNKYMRVSRIAPSLIISIHPLSITVYSTHLIQRKAS